MSILKFLQVIEQALPPLSSRTPRPPARRRPMRLERLELRAVLDGDSSMMPPDYTPPEDYYPPEVTSMPPDYVPPEDYSPPDGCSMPPDYTPPEGNLPPEEPTLPESSPPEETPPDDEEFPTSDLPPYLYDVTFASMGGVVGIEGYVGDDMPVGGLTVYFFTDTMQSFTATVQANGHFSTSSIWLAGGTQVSFFTVDSNFNYSETMLLIV